MPRRLLTLAEQAVIKEKVILIEDNPKRDEFINLMNATDDYVSLHRSEGVALDMMKAISIGKPVIVTKYSGKLEFMSDGNSLLIAYEVEPISENTSPYKAGWP